MWWFRRHCVGFIRPFVVFDRAYLSCRLHYGEWLWHLRLSCLVCTVDMELLLDILWFMLSICNHGRRSMDVPKTQRQRMIKEKIKKLNLDGSYLTYSFSHQCCVYSFVSGWRFDLGQHVASPWFHVSSETMVPACLPSLPITVSSPYLCLLSNGISLFGLNSGCCSVSWWCLHGQFVPLIPCNRPPLPGPAEGQWGQHCQPGLRNGRQLHCHQHSQQ